MNMKQLKPIIITAIACVVVAGIGAGVYFLFPQRENIVDHQQSDEHADIIISKKSAKMVESIEVKPADGGSFEIIYSTDKDGNQIGTVKGAGGEFRYNGSDLYTIAGYVSYILAIEEIEDPKGRDDEFGFDNPRQRIKVNFKGNQKLELILGGDAPSGDGLYLKRKDTGRVYLIGGSTAEMLMMSLLDYRDISLFDNYNSPYEINEVSIKRPGEDKITVRRKEGVKTNVDGTAADETEARYEIVSPDKSDAENALVEEGLIVPLINVRAESLIEDHPKDLGKYGLKDPIVIELEDKYGTKHKIKVGDRSENGGHYVMSDDIPSVVVTEEPIAFLDISHASLMMKLVWRHNFADVSKLECTLPNGSVHTLVISGSSITFDGNEVTRDNAVNLFMHTIQFEIQDSITNDMKYGDATYKIAITKTDGSVATLGLSQINERQFAVSVNGEKPMYYVNVAQVNALENAINIMIQGGDVPSVF